MNEKDIIDLMERWRNKLCTDEELAMLESHVLHEIDTQDLPERQIDRAELKAEMWAVVKPKRSIQVRLYRRYAAIAAITLIFGSATFYYFKRQQVRFNPELAYHIRPGGNAARLTLANGKEISLNNLTGKVAANPQVLISNNPASGVITYQVAGSTTALDTIQTTKQPAEVNTLSTPRGGQYEIILSDGTRVVLNSASSLQFSARFASGERRVSLIGEGYFQVAKDPKRPFLVITKGQTIRVLGTHFNVSAYPDDTTRTTLAEGRVELTSSSSLQKQPLEPDQQASLLSTGKFAVKTVNAANVGTWRKGYFRFDSTPIADAVRQLCRWYNVDADFAHLPAGTVQGLLNKNLSLAECIKSLEYDNNITIQITDERRLIISKKD